MKTVYNLIRFKYISQENISDGDLCTFTILLSTWSWIHLSQGDYPPVPLSGYFQIWHMRCSSCFLDECLEIRIFTELFLMQVKGYKSSMCLPGDKNKTDVTHLSTNTICLQLSFPTSFLFLSIFLGHVQKQKHFSRTDEAFQWGSWTFPLWNRIRNKSSWWQSWLNQYNMFSHSIFRWCLYLSHKCPRKYWGI